NPKFNSSLELLACGGRIIWRTRLDSFFRYLDHLSARLLDVVDLDPPGINPFPFDYSDEEVRTLRVGLLAQIGTLWRFAAQQLVKHGAAVLRIRIDIHQHQSEYDRGY